MEIVQKQKMAIEEGPAVGRNETYIQIGVGDRDSYACAQVVAA